MVKNLPDWLLLQIFIMNHYVVGKRNTLKLGPVKMKLFFKKIEKFWASRSQEIQPNLSCLENSKILHLLCFVSDLFPSFSFVWTGSLFEDLNLCLP